MSGRGGFGGSRGGFLGSRGGGLAGGSHTAIHHEWDPACKVWVGGLGDEGTRLEIEEAFGQIGPVKNIWLAKNPPGFAFVEMEVSYISHGTLNTYFADRYYSINAPYA